MAGDCEMVGVLILGIQSLDRAGQASCQSLQFVTVGSLWERANCPKVRYVFAGLPPGTLAAEAGRTVTPLMWSGRGGWGIPVVTPHLTPQISSDQSWHQLHSELHRGRQWTIKECDHQFDLSGLTGARAGPAESDKSQVQCDNAECLCVISDHSPSHHPVTLSPITLSVSFLKTFFRLGSAWADELLSFRLHRTRIFEVSRLFDSDLCQSPLYPRPDLSSSGGEF